MSKAKKLRKAYNKELALELRGGSRKIKRERSSEEELIQIIADTEARKFK